MTCIGDPRLLFFRHDLQIQLSRHTIELGNHHVELQELLALLVDLKLLEPHQVLT